MFPVVTYDFESWTIKKAKHQRIDAFELWCWRRLLRVPWTVRRSNQPVSKESNDKTRQNFQYISVSKCRDTLPTKVCIVRAIVFPVVTYSCDSWTIKKAERQRIYAFEV